MEFKQISITMLTIAIAVVMLFVSVQESESKPSITDGWIQYHNRFGVHDPQRRATHECENSSREVRELCQRCAKVTKSRLAYPMCCEARENAREWCRELLIVG